MVRVPNSIPTVFGLQISTTSLASDLRSGGRGAPANPGHWFVLITTGRDFTAADAQVARLRYTHCICSNTNHSGHFAISCNAAFDEANFLRVGGHCSRQVGKWKVQDPASKCAIY